ncbi:hypothetical protein Afil01_15910 [Actinorhabdospora filicis]|uniref:Uncharacterized protein n=1 Tax=Actinorhabdospora filicis TaxID=1785913 RepID=A0A9W6SGM3_9ACTN|nr:hypothetical protein [Actinorhabdospora filicis]GLZ76784.1 hypothetical protein Afil01_15910 [Actinorhabdospora filicis]
MNGYGVDPAALRHHADATRAALDPARGLTAEGEAATAALRALVDFGDQLADFVRASADAYARVDTARLWETGSPEAEPASPPPSPAPRADPGGDPVAALRAAADAHETAVAALTGWTGRASEGYRGVAAMLATELRATAALLATGDADGLRGKARAYREVAAVLAEQSTGAEILPTPTP